MMYKFIKTLALASVGVFAAQTASAACSAPNLTHPNDAILQLKGSSSSGPFLGGVTSSASADARAEGAIYYDSGTKSLVFCNGTDWISAAGGGGAGSESGSQTVSSRAFPDSNSFGMGPPDGRYGADVPDHEIGMGDFTFDISFRATDGNCSLYLRDYETGALTLVHKHDPGHKNYNKYVKTSLKVVDNRDGTHTWMNNGGHSYEFRQKPYSEINAPFERNLVMGAGYNSQCRIEITNIRRIGNS